MFHTDLLIHHHDYSKYASVRTSIDPYLEKKIKITGISTFVQ